MILPGRGVLLSLILFLLLHCANSSPQSYHGNVRPRIKLTSKSSSRYLHPDVPEQIPSYVYGSVRSKYKRKHPTSSANRKFIRKTPSIASEINLESRKKIIEDMSYAESVQHINIAVKTNLNAKNSSKLRETTEDSGKDPSVPVSGLNTQPNSVPKGWLVAPTLAPRKNRPAAKLTAKQGNCGPTVSYGIKCMMRLDQCKIDKDCPGDTKCCEVGECGRMCVMPKALSEFKEEPVEKKKRYSSDNKLESSTTAEGLKIEDITGE